MARRHVDWMAQAQRDLSAAQDSLEAGHYEWSAFQSQQAAEKALKALLRFHNYEATGHTLLHLLERVGDFVAVPPELRAVAQDLDHHYVQPRYPNSFPEGYPGEFYNAETAQRCIEHGKRILGFVTAQLP